MSTGLRAFGDLRLSYDLRAIPLAIQAVASSDAYVAHDFDVPVDESYWLTFRLAVTPNGFDAFINEQTVHNIFRDNFQLLGGKWGSEYVGDIDSPVPTYDAWHLIETHHDVGAEDPLSTMYIDSTVVGDGTIADSRATASIRFGVIQGNPGDTTYIRDIRMGTTRLGTDILEWNGTDLSQFDVTGNVTVVVDPF